MRGLGCESRAVRWAAVLSLKTVRTCGMCRSKWRVWLETYHGALVIIQRSLDWYRWMTAILDLAAHPHYTANAPGKISCYTTHFRSDERMINKRSNFVKKGKYAVKVVLQLSYLLILYKKIWSDLKLNWRCLIELCLTVFCKFFTCILGRDVKNAWTLCDYLFSQNKLHVWVRDRRQHHKYSDTDGDPHNSTRGFFFSHCGWLLMR